MYVRDDHVVVDHQIKCLCDFNPFQFNRSIYSDQILKLRFQGNIKRKVKEREGKIRNKKKDGKRMEMELLAKLLVF